MTNNNKKNLDGYVGVAMPGLCISPEKMEMSVAMQGFADGLWADEEMDDALRYIHLNEKPVSN